MAGKHGKSGNLRELTISPGIVKEKSSLGKLLLLITDMELHQCWTADN